MSGLVLSVGLAARPLNPHEARAMAASGAYRSGAGTYEGLAGTAVAIYLDGREEPGVLRSSPLVAGDGSLLLVADARIDNRREIAALLDAHEAASCCDDGALLLKAYERWGESFADRLVGDFCVAVWDVPRRRLVAARDAQGQRPLHYRIEAARILVASDVNQVLAADGVPRTLCEERIMAMLAGNPGLPEWTFYAGVRRLPPGHTLVVDEHGERLRQHPLPIREDISLLSADESTEELRARLREAVRARLAVSAAPGLLLSGGLDSTSVAGTAGRLRADGESVPLLRTYSFAFDDLPQCDERHISSLIVAHYGLPNVPVPASDAWPLAGYPEHGPDIDGPTRFRSHVVMDRALDAAHRDGVRVLMTGQRGDSLTGGAVVDHLGRLRDAGPLALWRDLSRHSARSGRSRCALFEQHVLGRLLQAAWPRDRFPAVRRGLRRLVRRADERFPPWLRREAIGRFNLADIIERTMPRSLLRGEARRRRHTQLLDPALARNAEALERKFARAGIRHADPWADARLAELVLRMPQYMITPAGEPKRLLREAVRGVVPESARLSASKRSPQDSYARGLVDGASAAVLSLIHRSRAGLRGYVDEGQLRAAYSRFREDPGRVTEREWRPFWRYLDLEDWLRRFHDE